MIPHTRSAAPRTAATLATASSSAAPDVRGAAPLSQSSQKRARRNHPHKRITTARLSDPHDKRPVPDTGLTAGLALLARMGRARRADPVGVVDADARWPASDVMDAQGDVARAGCAGMMIGSPWWNVYAPTTSISYQCSAGACAPATQDSRRAGVEWRACTSLVSPWRWSSAPAE